MKTCPECFGSGLEYDEKGFKTGHGCATCGGTKEVTEEEFKVYHEFYGSKWEDDPDYVEDSWRIKEGRNAPRPLNSGAYSEANSQGGRCLGILILLVSIPAVALIQIIT